MNCPICYESLDSVPHIELSCGHKFRDSCIATMVKKQMQNVIIGTKFESSFFNCPCCRKPFLPSFFKNSAVVTVPLPFRTQYRGSVYHNSDKSFAQFVFDCFEVVAKEELSPGNKLVDRVSTCQFIYQICSHTFTDVGLAATFYRVDGIKCDEMEQSLSISHDLMRLADQTLSAMESSVFDIDLDQDYHMFSPEQSRGINRMVNSFLSASSSLVRYVQRPPQEDVTYNEWVSMGRPVSMSEISREVDDGFADLMTQTTIEEGDNDENLDPINHDTHFLCAQCLAEYHLDSRSPTNGDMCSDCWSMNMNRMVEEEEESHFQFGSL